MCKGGGFLLYFLARGTIITSNFRHAPSLNKFRVGIHSESTFAFCGPYAKMGVFRQASWL